MPRAGAAKKKVVESNEQQMGQDHPRAMKSTGPARESLEPSQIEAVDGPVNKEWAEAMRFNEEILEVVVHESAEKNAEKIIEVFNNGIPQRFVRGQKQPVKRKYVEVLAKAKITTYTQEKRTDDDGNQSYVNIPHTACRYPFAVLSDPSPNGSAWLQKVLAEV